MFTKQHYVVLARLIKHNMDYQRFVEDLIHTLKVDNPKFDELKFRFEMGGF